MGLGILYNMYALVYSVCFVMTQDTLRDISGKTKDNHQSSVTCTT